MCFKWFVLNIHHYIDFFLFCYVHLVDSYMQWPLVMWLKQLVLCIKWFGVFFNCLLCTYSIFLCISYTVLCILQFVRWLKKLLCAFNRKLCAKWFNDDCKKTNKILKGKEISLIKRNVLKIDLNLHMREICTIKYVDEQTINIQ